MSISFKNFFQQNTPKQAQIIGDTLLLLAAIGGGLLLMPQEVAAQVPSTAPAVVLPSWMAQTASWMVGLGTLGKIVTKFFGEATAESTDVTNDSSNQ